MSKRAFEAHNNLFEHSAKRQRLYPEEQLIALQEAPPRNSFKGLRLEIRRCIYRAIFNDIVAEPIHGYDEYPDNRRFEDYRTLQLIDRQTRLESKRVFEKEGYVDNICFYYDDAPSIYDLHRRLRLNDDPFLKRIRFKLRAWEPFAFHEEECLKDEEVEMLIGAQAEEEMNTWVNFPGLYRAAPEDFGPFRDFFPASTHHMRSTWKPDDHGFQVLDFNHSTCSSSAGCKPHKVVKFPPLERSLRLTTHCWPVSPGEEGVRQSEDNITEGIMVLTGRLADLCFDDFFIERSRARLIKYLIQQASPREKERFAHKYPVTEEEFADWGAGLLVYSFEKDDAHDARNRQSSRANRTTRYHYSLDEGGFI